MRTRKVPVTGGVGRVFDHDVTSLREGGTRYEDGVLTVDVDELRRFVLEDERLPEAEVSLVSPGDNVRLVHALDSIRPVCNARGPRTGAFPGTVSPIESLATGDSHRLQGVVVTVLGLTAPVDSFLTQQEGVLDMAGPGARYSPLTREHHVVIHLGTPDHLDNDDRAEAYRMAGLRAAEWLAALAVDARDGTPVEGIPTDLSITSDDRPRITHVCEVSTFGRLFDTYIGGKPSLGMFPTLVGLRALADGFVVSADYHYAGQRNLTCFYQDDPVSRALLGPFRERARYAGTILIPIGGSHPEKERAANHSANIAQLLGADGVIVTAVAAGNAHLDVMFVVRACERRGIPTALQLVEMAGPDGADPGMIDTVPEADLVISVGNREEIVELPARGTVLGGDMLIDPATGEQNALDATGAIEVPLRAILGVNNEMGAWTLGARAS